MNRQSGFTALEIIVAIILIIGAGAFFYLQKRDLVEANLDSQRKTAVNTIYYNLEVIFYPNNSAYPETLSVEQLKGVESSFLTDPSGKAVNEIGSTIRYQPTNCNTQSLCKNYTLVALQDNEANFIKTSAR